MSGFRYRRTKSFGGGLYGTMTNAGPRVGVRKGRVTASAGRTGPYLGVRVLRGLWYVFKGR